MNTKHRFFPQLSIVTAALLLLAGCASSDTAAPLGSDGDAVTVPGKADNSGQPDTSKLPKSKTGGYTHGMPMTDFNFENTGARIPTGEAVRVTLPEEALAYEGLSERVMVKEFVVTPIAFDTLEVFCGVAMDVTYANPDIYDSHFSTREFEPVETDAGIKRDPQWVAAARAVAYTPPTHMNKNAQFGLPDLDDPEIGIGTYISKDRSQVLVVDRCTDSPMPTRSNDHVARPKFTSVDLGTDSDGPTFSSYGVRVGVTSSGELGVTPDSTNDKGEPRVGRLFFEQSTQKWRKW
ncbi:MAG: hypothetical protein ACTJGT_03945 [Microbacteriaceae bacterium]